MSCAVHAVSCAILYFIRPYLVFLVLIVIPIALLSHMHVRQATFVALYLLPPQRVTVTTGKGSLVPLDELKLLVTNVGSL